MERAYGWGYMGGWALVLRQIFEQVVKKGILAYAKTANRGL